MGPIVAHWSEMYSPRFAVSKRSILRIADSISPDALSAREFLKESSDGSRHQQLREQLRQAILDGRLASGTWLPSTRALAQTLGVSRTVTSSAYDELFAEGYLEGRQGSGT